MRPDRTRLRSLLALAVTHHQLHRIALLQLAESASNDLVELVHKVRNAVFGPQRFA